METISSSETLRDVINGMAVRGTVYKDLQNPSNSRIDSGSVNTEDGQHLASWSLNGDNALNLNYSGQATDRAAVLTAIETFIDKVSKNK